LSKPIEMPFWGLTQLDPRNHVLNGGQDGTNLFAASTNNMSAMAPFAKLVWALVIILIQCCNYHCIERVKATSQTKRILSKISMIEMF